MVLTGSETALLFEASNQMYIPDVTVIQLVNEGISEVINSIDFDKDTLQQIANNILRPWGMVPDPNYIFPVPFPKPPPLVPTIPTPTFIFGTKPQKCLIIACYMIRLYEMIIINVTEANIQWVTVTRRSGEQYNYITDYSKEDDPDTTKISKALTIIKWTGNFRDHLRHFIGLINASPAYVIMDYVSVPDYCPALASGQPYSV